MMRRALVFSAAAAIDSRFGEPPNRLHPVALLGRSVGLLEGRAPREAEERKRFGTGVAAALPVAAGVLAAAVPGLGGGRWSPLRLAGEAGMLSTAFALRSLLDHAGEVRAVLQAGDVEGARRVLSTHLVSRETAGLDGSGVAAATIESVAENLSDSVVAPWFAYTIGGLPAAWAYRAVNTLDAMWGYRDETYRHLGYGAARLDDALNYVPSRLTALAICAAAAEEGRAGEAWRTWRRDGARTESPNAGQPMAAMAGALGVELSKHGAYVLGSGYRRPEPADIDGAVRVARRASALAGAALMGMMVGRGTRLTVRR
jgi:adenosylcobinamide-phosphate synthase